ncbi:MULTISPECIES: hypothetical protein [Streptomyces]|uniref:hypothetical protein n=1 Tax=Streptomyces TaxID=1883 RepID=UPI0031EE3C6E
MQGAVAGAAARRSRIGTPTSCHDAQEAEKAPVSASHFAKLGLGFEPKFTGETAACMLVGEHAFVMLLSREKPDWSSSSLTTTGSLRPAPGWRRSS